jgi:peptide-methionine (R)-S-oxide reductase
MPRLEKGRQAMTTNYTRRYLLLGGAGLAALALFRWPNQAGAEAKGPFEVTKSDEEWRKILNKEQFEILRKHGTERAGTSPLNREKRKGTFACAGCDLPLFSSETKFESGTGWPSFWRALPGAVVTRSDTSLLMDRTEVLCSRCGGHLGHVFNDGPRPTGLRYCMNGLALQFRAA